MDINISKNLMGGGINKLEQMGSKLASTVNEATSGEEMSQVKLIELQQKMANYNNTISMMSNILKNLTDTNKEVIRAM